MLEYQLKKAPGMPLYEALCTHMRADIASGALKPGEHLPSKRELAADLGVSVVTVEHAYQQLVAEGYLQAKARKGFFVCKLEHVPSSKRREPAPAPLHAEQPKPNWRFDLASPSLVPDAFPTKEWARLTREVLLDDGSLLSASAPAAGLPHLREQIATHASRARGIDCSPEQVFVGAGSQALYRLLTLMMPKDTRIAVEDPGYPRLAQTYRAHGLDVGCVPIDEHGLSVDALRASKANVAHVTPSHHFPTGAVMPVTRRYELLAWAAEKPGRIVIEDDYDCEFRLAGKPIPALKSIDAEQRVVYLNTFSKSIAPSLRIAYMVLPPRLATLFDDKLGFLLPSVSSLEQEVLARFIENGGFDRHVRRMCKRYRDVRDALVESLRPTVDASGGHLRNLDSGLFFTIAFGRRIDEEAFASSLAEQGINAAFTSAYTERELPESTLIVNYAGLTVEDAREVAG